jgi:hypothetical protein
MSTELDVRQFLKESGFKILALARLSQCEYSVMLYLLNCAVSGLDQIITTESEFASLMGYDEMTVKANLGQLAGKNLIRLHYSDTTRDEEPSMRLGVQFDMSKWILAYDVEATSRDAVVFPFRRQGQTNLLVVEGHKKDPKSKKHDDSNPTWSRVLESFVQGRSLDDAELDQAEESARILVETHPVDQVLLMIRHFGLRIPTLSLLASSWQHYQDIFEHETQKVDMMGARQKHQEMDTKLRTQAETLLASEDQGLTEEERGVLNILLRHRHPRRQLFWAYQLRSRYPGLTSFFADNVGLMLSVTSGGTVVKKHES